MNIRAGLNRHLTSPPYNRQLNLMHDREFQAANQVFYGLIRTLRQAGLDRTTHKDAISASDMALMYSSGCLSVLDPASLQRKVYVEIALHFCRRGREGLRELKQNSFVEKTDENGRVYVTLNHIELEKNHQGLGKGNDGEEPRMYAQGGDSCPVSSFRLYISKLNPKCDAFFQKANVNYDKTGLWYANAPVGKNTLAGFMKDISKRAKLSKEYTNHCLRVTAVSVLHNHGYEAMDICSVSRHRHTDSLKSYSKGPSDERRYSMSSTLHSHGERSLCVAGNKPQSSCRQVDDPQPSTSRQADEADARLALERNVERNVVVSNEAVTSNVMKSLFAGAVFHGGSAPVFNFNGNFNISF